METAIAKPTPATDIIIVRLSPRASVQILTTFGSALIFCPVAPDFCRAERRPAIHAQHSRNDRAKESDSRSNLSEQLPQGLPCPQRHSSSSHPPNAPHSTKMCLTQPTAGPSLIQIPVLLKHRPLFTVPGLHAWSQTLLPLSGAGQPSHQKRLLSPRP